MACINPNDPAYQEILARVGNPILAEIEFDKQNNISDVISSTASPKTIAMVNDFLTRIGVDTKAMKNVIVDGVKQDAAGAALLTQKLIQVVEGKEAQSLPEEAMHFAVAIIKQTNPALYKKLMSEINGYAMLKEVFATYGQNPMYQLDGKPDVIMLKEEAIAKVLAEIIIKNNEGSLEKPENIAKMQSLWDKIVDWFKNLISTSGFDQLSMDVMTGKIIGTAEDIREEEGKAFLQLDPQEAIINRIKEVSNSIEKPTEGGYKINGKVIPRVSALVDEWYERTFRNGDINKTEFQNAVNDLKAEKGTAGHADLEYIQTLFVDDDGYLRDTQLDDTGYISRINPNNRDMYTKLKENLEARLKSFPKGTRFMAEVTIYNPKANRAGTVDFLAVTKEGDVSILDWKFMDLDVDKYTDIPWYKNTAWNLQMEQYRAILQNAYGVKGEKFKQTRMIPIKALYSKANPKENILPALLSIKIGDVNVKNIKDDYLLPVPIKNEKTGKRKIDELLGELNKLYTKISDKSVPESEKLNKDELLNSLFHSIRQLQVKENIQPLVRQAQLLNKTIDKLIERYNDKFVDKDAKSFSEKEVNDFVKEISDAQYAIGIYTDLYSELKGLLGDSKEDEDLKKDLRRTSENAKELEDDLEVILEEFTANIIAQREEVDNFLAPEKIIKGFTKLFASTATLQSKAIQLLYKKANRAFAYSSMDTLAESKKLEDLKTNFENWAKGKGLSYKNYFDILKKKDSNELIDEYNPEFYTDLKAKTKKELESVSDDRDSSWIRENIDVTAYNEHLKEKLAEEIERIKSKPRLLTSEESDALANTGKLPNEVVMEIYKARNLYDTSTTTSSGWFIYNETRKFPKKDKWTSKEWIELNKPENAPAKEFYNYIIEKNNEYADLGYINKRFARTFLPFIRKNLVEKLITGGQVKLGQQFFTDISVDEGDIGYGQIDPNTGKPVNKIPKYFTRPLEQETSTDLFRTMAFYNEAALRYKYLSEIEDQVMAIVAVEKNKKSIATSMFGKTDIKDGVVQYTETKGANSQLVEDMMKAIIYGQKFVDSQAFDQLLSKMGTWGETLNNKLGVDVFPKDISNRQLSVNKLINQLNNTFQITTLGFNVLSASSNFFGGNAQSLINSGKYFTKKDYLAAEMMIFSNKFGGTDQKKMLGALEYFLPLTENYNREIAKKLSLNTLSQEGIQDFLLILMKQTDLNVQTSNFYAFLNNSIVEDGKVINVRDYLRTQPEYQDKYKGSVADRKAYEEKFDAEVKRLIEEKGVLKLGEIIDNKFVIPGIDQKSDSVIELRRKVQQVSKDALGNLSEDDLRMINMSVVGKSFMVFKNWIPRLVDVRLGGLKFNSASDAYEWGRTRMVMKVLTDEFSLTNPVSGLGKLYNSLTGNEKGVEYMKDMFEKKRNEYENETGKTLEMTESEFIDLARQNIKSQLVDVVFLAIVFTAIAALKAAAPDKDEDPLVINQYKFMMKATDKFKGELMYFYDPTSGLDLISQGFFPSAALITNFARLMDNFRKENWALLTGDDEAAEKTHVIKYLMKTFPFTNQMQGYLPMFYPALAKDLGIKVQSNYGLR
jgi:predicted dinucleotide-binding enzyme